MRRLIYSLFVVAATLSATACMDIDNFDAPDCHISGRIIDATSPTGENILSDQGHYNIRIWERSFENAAPQSLSIAQDGTYNNTKLFAGTYDMLPLGAWWPCDTLFDVGIGKRKVQDFTVTPYLKLIDFKWELSEDRMFLKLSCRLQAPKSEGMPVIMEIRPFLSLNQFCGESNQLGWYNIGNTYRVKEPANPNRDFVNKDWATLVKDETDESITADTYSTTVPVKPGYIYFVRMGARVRDDAPLHAQQKYNYTTIEQVIVPQ